MNKKVMVSPLPHTLSRSKGCLTGQFFSEPYFFLTSENQTLESECIARFPSNPNTPSVTKCLQIQVLDNLRKKYGLKKNDLQRPKLGISRSAIYAWHPLQRHSVLYLVTSVTSLLKPVDVQPAEFRFLLKILMQSKAESFYYVNY